jgi:hypothetical protein
MVSFRHCPILVHNTPKAEILARQSQGDNLGLFWFELDLGEIAKYTDGRIDSTR